MNEGLQAYTDLDSNISSEAVLPEEIETQDFSTKYSQPVGNYITNQRKITVKKREDGHLSFKVEHIGGLVFVETGGVWAEKFPLMKFLTTTPYQQGTSPGKTSGVAQYLRACGFEPKGLEVEGLINAMIESQTIPVEVFVGRTDKGKKQQDGSYTQKNLKLKDFNTGTKEAPVYAESVTIDGEVFEARPNVGSYSKIKAN
jgi:hypothetical protein